MSTKRLMDLLLLSLCALSLGSSPASGKSGEEDPLEGLSLTRAKLKGDVYTQVLEDGRKITLTLNAKLQSFADGLFDRYKVPAGAAVVLNSRTGRVLAMSQRYDNKRMAKLSDVALDPSPPAASLFKIVTAAALLEAGAASMDTSECYHGGSQKLEMHNLIDSKRDDSACASLGTALGRSINPIFAKLSDRRLDRTTLRTYAERFGFNKNLPFDMPVPVSKADIPKQRLERARTAAGFWHTQISPLHAAVVAQSIAQGGSMLRPYIVDKVTNAKGETIYKGEPAYLGRTVEKATARKLLQAMTLTVKKGTARKAFRDDKGTPLLPGVEVAGKTGTLHGKKPYRAYSWFVGVAPAEAPRVAIAVLVVNEPEWRIKSAATAARILKEYFEIFD